MLFVIQGFYPDGRLSAQKRLDHFDFLSDEEIAGMERPCRPPTHRLFDLR